jgi:hypothetical protein
MEIVPNSDTVANFCEDLGHNSVRVDFRYQRSEKVWPKAAQSFLIESILLGYPVPKLYLHQKTDRISRSTIHYIVDGQQRTVAIKSFYDDEIRLSKALELKEAAGRTYSELPDELQDRFLSYPLGLDLFVNASEEQVREIFRRINSYEVPLNAEEQRHARWQGDFKWYIYRLSRHLDQFFANFGTFTDSQLVRMQDMKLLAEVSHALLNGITTTNKESLDRLYRDNDEKFDEEVALRKQIEGAVDFIDHMPGIHGSGLMKTYSMYSLILAIAHAREAIDPLQKIVKGGTGLASQSKCQQRLSILAAAVDENERIPRKLNRFVRATEKGTNVKDKRSTRFEFFFDAVSKKGGTLIPGQ